MKTQLNQSLSKGLQVMECLFEKDFEGKTVTGVMEATGLPHITAWRTLKTLELCGWVREVQRGKKQSRWIVTEKITEIAFQYRRYVLSSIQTIEKNYLDVAGEKLNHD